MRAPWHRRSPQTSQRGSDDRRRGALGSLAPGLKITVTAAIVIVVAASAYDRDLGLILLLAAVIACLLHVTVVYLADVGLLWPAAALVGCLGIALWVYLPDNFDIRSEILSRAPAPVARLLDPVLRRIAAGGDMIAAPAPSRDARVAFVQAAGAGAKSPPSSAVRTGMSVKPAAAVAITLTQSSQASVRGTHVRFTVTVRPAKGSRDGLPLGRVDLIDGSSRLQTADLIAAKDVSRAVFNVSSLPAGDHVLAARYDGTARFASATSALLVHSVKPSR